MTDPMHPLERYLDLMSRAIAANEDEPPIVADQDIVDQWVLVPRAHLRTIQSWGGEIDETEAVAMITNILADARLIGRK